MKKHPRIAVTDHAVIRYMERVLGLDIDPVRAAIADVAGPAVRTGATAIITDGFRYVVRDGAVATVTRANSDPKHARDGQGGGEE